MKQGKRVANTTESKTQIFNCEVFSIIFFRINSFNDVFSIRDCWFCYMSKFDLLSDGCLFKFTVVYCLITPYMNLKATGFSHIPHENFNVI